MLKCWKVTATVEPILKDHAIGLKNVVLQDHILKANGMVFGDRFSYIECYTKNIWSFKTGGLMADWSLTQISMYPKLLFWAKPAYYWEL